MLDPILPEFEAYLRSITLNPPQIPIISNRTGQPLSAEEATDPSYWVQHLRNTVHFSEGIATLAGKRDRVYLEVGPGRALSSLAKASGKVEAQAVLSSLRHADEDIADDLFFLETIGRLWACGIQVDWDQIWGDAKRRRVPLQTYPFQRKRYFIEPADGVRQGSEPPLIRSEEIAEWGFAPAWLPRSAPCPVDVAHDLAEAERHVWLVFCDTVGLGAGCAARLRDAGHTVIEVRAGDRFLQTGDMSYTLAPERGREGYDLLLASLVQRGITPDRIAHFWLTTREEEFRPGSSFFHRNIEQGFYSLMFLAQAIIEEDLPSPIQITIATSDTVQVRNEALLYPEKATVAGPARVIPRELPGVTCRTIDVSLPPAKRSWRRGGGDAELLDGLVSSILEEMLAEHGNSDAALRGGRRYELGIRTVPLEPAETWAETAPEGGAWFITGGFGGIGLSVGEKLARETSARLVLVSRSPLPDRSEWDHYLRERPVHDLTARRIEAVRRLEAAGAEVMVATADVCNVSQMRAAIAAATERFGPIHGVIHAAGTVDDAPLLTKDVSSVENVFSAKIHGTQVLDSLFPDGSIKQMVLFSSTSTITAPAGQIDYVAANEYLNAYAKARTGERVRHKNRATVHWDYERLVLERFPKVFKVKCFASMAGDTLGPRPGGVLVVVIPHPERGSTGGTRAPKMNATELERIQFDLPGLVDEAIAATAVAAGGKGLELVAAVPTDVPRRLLGDPGRLRQCLLNLLGNAVKFTQSGDIVVRAKRDRAVGGDWFEIAVSDSGIGMSVDQMSRLFNAFVQADAGTARRYGGTGLGLAITRRTMQLLGGDVSAVSEPGQGSTFTLRFPAELPAAPAQTLARVDMATAAGQGGKRIVLVIDDEASARDLTARSLTRLGFDVRGAAHGEEGLQLARALKPSLIVVDINLPDMTGWDVIRQLSAEQIDAPVIVHSVDDDRQHAISLGACDLLVKPADRDVLAAAALRFARASETSEPAAPALPISKTA